MPLNTFTVATAVTPSVIETYISHYLNRAPLRQKPTAHISYHEGLRLIRQFLLFSSKNTVEDIQAFTAQWVPVPTWVRTHNSEIPPQYLERAAAVLRQQLEIYGLDKVGGDKWWQWRRPDSPLHAEWIEMKKDYNERKRKGVECDRVMLYVHGGAYYFGSVDEHRYQIQRHARKLKARVLAPRYRLAPQFPFPCGLYDCLAAYFFLLEQFDPSQILLAGDSAGGGMALAMLITLRDQGCPLPAGTILLSPWVDLAHSFPSVAGDDSGDYIPSHGFLHKPSMAWPPPPTEKLERKFSQPIEQPFEVVELSGVSSQTSAPKSEGTTKDPVSKKAQSPSSIPKNQIPGFGDKLELEIDGKLVEVRDQVQLYARNELLTHPLVSPVQAPSLGGLPPMLIQVGGGVGRRDEQIYLAHKAANPKAYPPSETVLDEFDPKRSTLNRYAPTNVQLQVWEDLCHVPHTLSFTRPAKYMYRSVAQFGAWALAHAQHKGIEIRDDDAISIISTDSDDPEEKLETGAIPRTNTHGSISITGVTSTQYQLESLGAVGVAGDELPAFKNHMIRQRVNRHGLIFPLPDPSEIESLHLERDSIGAIKAGPVRKWLARKAEKDKRYARLHRKLQRRREQEVALGYDKLEDGEVPPPSAIVNRRRNGIAPEQKKKRMSWGLALWSGWGSSHDETTLEREAKVAGESQGDVVGAFTASDAKANESVADTSSSNRLAVPSDDADGKKGIRDGSRPRSPLRKVTDSGQADEDKAAVLSPDAGAQATSTTLDFASADVSAASTRPVSNMAPIPTSTLGKSTPQSILLTAPTATDTSKEPVKIAGSDNTYLNRDGSRPHNGVVAYPFKLGRDLRGHSPNPSTMTLDSMAHSEVEASQARSRAASILAPNTASELAAIETVPATGVSSKAHTQASTSTTAVQQVEAVSPLDPSPTASTTAWKRASLSADHTTPSLVSGVAAVSPVEPSFASPSTAASSSLIPPTGTHNTIKYRDSRIGNLGADGMPTSAFPGFS